MKFINLLKKELSELLNKQMFIGLILTTLIFMFVGNIMETTISDAVNETYSLNICNNDDGDMSDRLMDMLSQMGENDALTLKVVETQGEDYADIINDNDISSLIIIPEGFSDTLAEGKPAELISISRMTSAATMSNLSNDTSGAVSVIEKCITNLLAENSGLTAEDLALMDAPISVSENTVIDDKSAAVSMDNVMSKVMMQNMILPLIVFVLIMMTSQTLMSAISNEKIDKTLETLLSAPVSRTAVISAKMLAAAVVALINAAVYMVGFSVFVSGATDTVTEELSTSVVTQAISVEVALAQLGLSLGITDYLVIGIQLFLTIMICLSVSLILGAMVNDTKSSQTMIMPIMMLAMVPYMISMLADVNAMPTAVRMLVYAIPFTHTFSAMSNLMFGNDAIFFGGLIYQAVFFAICMFFALRLFKSDKIFTISLNFGQKAKFKKNSG
ncbi:MAG: ABC transporter permease, partial [Ruminococcus sp.]|nr:ABC transporter permease [Ruminococcus sp.]